VREIRGEEKPEKEPVEVLADLEAYLPDEYVGSSDQKISIYRKLSAVENTGELHTLRDEMVDRFGPLPTVGRNLLKLLEVKVLASDFGIQSVSIRGDRTSIVFREGHPYRMDSWNEVLERRSFGIVATWDGQDRILLESRGSSGALESLRKVLQEVSR
jgi:transcription-repair coupling factor (superfamily II helicase)